MNTYTHPKVSLFSQAHITGEIESLVNDIITDKPSRVVMRKPFAHRTNNWYQYYIVLLGSLERYLTICSGMHVYTEHLSAFLHGCNAAGLLPQHYRYGVVQHRMQPVTFDQVVLFVSAIKAYAASLAFSRQAGDRYDQMVQKNLRQVARAKTALGQYSKSLVIALQVGIDKDYQHLVNIDQFYAYNDVLIHEIETNQLFGGKLYKSKGVEQGIKKGYHMHLGFVFNGHERWSDEYIALEIGRLWICITQGLGTFHTSNTATEKAKYAAQGLLGVGMIHRSDAHAIENAVRVLSYTTKIAKVDQYLRMRPRGRRALA